MPIACGGQKRTLDPLELELKEGAGVHGLETDPGPLQEQVLYSFEPSLKHIFTVVKFYIKYRGQSSLWELLKKSQWCVAL